MVPRRRVDWAAMTAAATFCATLVDEWVRSGLTDLVVSPGSRSTPLALAAAADGRLQVHVVLDERSAAFRAVGLGLATGRPAVLVCTSGTAAVEYHPAVVEAHQAAVPLVVCTADRPPELQGVGAPQTIDQQGLYGNAVRWAASPGVPDVAAAGSWRSLAARAVLEATGEHPGPVHLDLAFREPLGGEPDPLPAGRGDGGPWHRAIHDVACGPDVLDVVAAVLGGRRTVIVAGARCGDPRAIEELGAALGWPILADPRSGCDGRHGAVVAAWEPLLRAIGEDPGWQPEAVLRLGEPPASKVLGSWLADAHTEEVVVRCGGRWIDPARRAVLVVDAPVADLCVGLASLAAPAPDGWGTSWVSMGRRGSAALDVTLARHAEPTGPGIARALLAGLPEHTALVVSSSLPVRELEWFAVPRSAVAVYANRGANGIDGVVSTTVGVAVAAARGGNPTVGFLGDLALLHDSNGLAGVADAGMDLVFVVVDNDGGGIFSFLPQHGDLSSERFEQLFGTPHGMDLAALARAYGAVAHEAMSTAEVLAAVAVAQATGGLHVVVARTDRAANITLHAELFDAVAATVAEEP